jgi:hypothetical protein
MGEYRYKKAEGWLHTGDISDNFKGVDFYKGTEIDGIIDASTAVSMKTTKVENVNSWLISEPIKDNIAFLKQGLTARGLESNGKTFRIKDKARIDIYMPKENMTPERLKSWMDELSKITTQSGNKIEFNINSLEEFIK